MKSVSENVYLKTCSTSFPGTQSASFSTLDSLQGVFKVTSCSNTGFKLQSQMANSLGKCQYVIDTFKDNYLFILGGASRSVLLKYDWKWKLLSCVQLFATHGLYSPWNSLGQNTGVGTLSLLQEIFPTQGIKSRSPALQADSLPIEPQGKPSTKPAVP